MAYRAAALPFLVFGLFLFLAPVTHAGGTYDDYNTCVNNCSSASACQLNNGGPDNITYTCTDPDQVDNTPPPTCSISASPSTSAHPGDPVTLTVTATGVSTVPVDPGVGYVTIDAQGHGTATVHPTNTLTYTGTATNNGGQVSCTPATVTVNGSESDDGGASPEADCTWQTDPYNPENGWEVCTYPNAPACTLVAEPSSIASGGTTQIGIHWTATKTQSMTIAPYGQTGGTAVDPSSGKGSITVTASANEVFVAHLIGTDSETGSCQVTVGAYAPPGGSGGSGTSYYYLNQCPAYVTGPFDDPSWSGYANYQSQVASYNAACNPKSTCSGGTQDNQASGFYVSCTPVACDGSAPSGSGCPVLPDLTAGDVTPATAAVNVPVTLSSLITNIGSVSTGSGFTDLFEINPGSIPSNFSSIQTLRTYASSALAGGGSNTATASYTFASAGTYYVRACADMGTGGTGTINEVNEDNNCSPDWVAVTVSAPAPDLTAANVTPSGAVAGVATSLSSLITNGGTATTGVGFTDLFEINPGSTPPPDFASIQTKVPYSSAALANGTSNTATASYTFPSAGTYSVRACADTTTSNTGVITESNEDNNCSPAWTTVTVCESGQTWNGTSCVGMPDLQGEPASVSPSSPTDANKLTFTANVWNAGLDTATNFPNYFQVTDQSNHNIPKFWVNANSLTLSPNQTGTVAGATNDGVTAGDYSVRVCANYDHDWNLGVPESDTTNNCGPWKDFKVTVCTSNCGTGDTLSCSVDNTNPGAGDTVHYTASNGSSPYTWTPSDGVGSYGTAASASRTFTSADAGKSFGMSVTSNGVTKNCSVVTVQQGTGCAAPASADITGTPNRVKQGSTAHLAWSAAGIPQADTCTISGPGYSKTVSPDSSCSVSGDSGTGDPVINTQSTYTIDCSAAEDSTTIDVVPNVIEF